MLVIKIIKLYKTRATSTNIHVSFLYILTKACVNVTVRLRLLW